MWVRIIHLTMAPTRHISELKYVPTVHGTIPSVLTPDLRLFIKPNKERDEGISAK